MSPTASTGCASASCDGAGRGASRCARPAGAQPRRPGACRLQRLPLPVRVRAQERKRGAPRPRRIISRRRFRRATASRSPTSACRRPTTTAPGARCAIPIVVVRNGKGPTLCSRAACTATSTRARSRYSISRKTLEPGMIQGRVIIIPALHFPPAAPARGTSPIDGRDSTGRFPGDPGGSFAPMLAHYVSERAAADLRRHRRPAFRRALADCLPCTMSHHPGRPRGAASAPWRSPTPSERRCTS